MNSPLLDQKLAESDLLEWWQRLSVVANREIAGAAHGDLPLWRSAVKNLPSLAGTTWQIEDGAITLSTEHPISASQNKTVTKSLQSLMPWRKGPFRIFDCLIDSEWRCDKKWRRLSGKIKPLTGRTVLDVGCGNGYYGYRMIDEDAACVIGIDPSWLYYHQFLAIQKYLPTLPVVVQPLGVDQLPAPCPGFDTVFSMGVLYHRRSPLDHLKQLKQFIRPGGELVLETLVIEGGENSVLVPADRYARMRNVWFIPSVAALKIWLTRCGYRSIDLVDISPTTSEEQRVTRWSNSVSLISFLDANDPGKTIEGYPAPKRAILRAENAR